MRVRVPTTPVGFLQLFLTLELLQFLTDETNTYASYVRDELGLTKSYRWVDCSLSDMARYLGMVIYMGLVPFPSMRWYWRSSFFMNCPQFAAAMTRNRFLAISRYFHTFNRKAIPKDNDDKLIIIKPILAYVKKRCQEILIPEQHLSLDEGMLPYKGRLSIKIYNPLKPHKYGLKFFFLCESSTGYVSDFVMYSGIYSSLEDTVFKLLDRFVGQGYHVFMDNYYNSVSLAQKMYDRGIHLSGTLRLARGAPAVLKSLGKLPTRDFPRGEMRFRRKGDVFVICWMGQRLVPMITNSHDTSTEAYVMKRRVKRGGRTVYEEVPMERPKVISHYTQYMGGVDLFDQMVNYYSFARRTQRWTKKVTMYLLQLAVQNSYSCYVRYTADTKKMTLLEYMDCVAEALVFFDRRQWQPSGDGLQHEDDLPVEERFDQLPPRPAPHMGPTPPSASASPVDDPDDPPAEAPARPPAAPSPPAPAVAMPPPPPPTPRTGSRPRVLDPACRLQPGDHEPQRMPPNRGRRCRVCFMNGIRKDSRYLCSTCQVPLCNKPTCFRRYHTEARYWSSQPVAAMPRGSRTRRGRAQQ